MAFPASLERIEEAEAQLGITFPAGLRARPARQNGGDLWIEDESWTLFPVWDPATKRTAARSASHVVRETADFHEGYAGAVPSNAVVVGDNEGGDYLLLVGVPPRPAIWRHEADDLVPVDVDWALESRPRLRRSPRSEAVARIAAALERVGEADGKGVAVVVEAAETPYYVQFSPTMTGYLGEAVGLANLPKLHVYQFGPVLEERLDALGWAAPRDGDHGNWTREWAQTSWNPDVVARLVADTFAQAYGLDPDVLTASNASFDTAEGPEGGDVERS